MNAWIALAAKDIRLLLRNRGALFFTMGWPLLVATFFGVVFGSGGSGAPKLALVVEDRSPAAERFATSLQALDTLIVDRVDAATAEQLVRQSKRSAAVVVPSGFGARSRQPFSNDPPEVGLWLDPSRKAERAMIEGQLMRLGGEAMFATFTDPATRTEWLATARAGLDAATPDTRARLDTLYDAIDDVMTQDVDPADSAAGGTDDAKKIDFTPIKVVPRDVSVARRGPGNGFAVSFTQAMFWALMGALMSFVTSLVLERMEGTWNRLRAGPQSAAGLLIGKSLACFAVMVASLSLIALVGATLFGVRPYSPSLLLLAFIAAAFAFTGLMMLLASFGRSVQSASGAAWAVLMPLAMVGGAMIPLFAMPPWMAELSNFSPVKWGVLAIEGAIWRGFSLAEMLTPVAILLATGVVCGALGAWRITRQPV